MSINAPPMAYSCQVATYLLAPNLGKPVPLHVQLEQERRASAPERPALRPAPLEIVTHTPQPWRRITIDQAPSAAAAFWRTAERLGYEVAGRMTGTRAVQVGVARDGVLWMRATWSRTEAGSLTAKGVIVDGEQGVTPVTVARAMLAVQSGA